MPLNIEKIKEFLQNSSLAQSEQDEFATLLSHENDSELEPIVELFGENPLWMKKFMIIWYESNKHLSPETRICGRQS